MAKAGPLESIYPVVTFRLERFTPISENANVQRLQLGGFVVNKVLLLTAASILALSAGSALASGKSSAGLSGKYKPFKTVKPAHVLWNQNSNYTSGVNSMNFTSTVSSSHNDQAADDFVVPSGKVWKIAEVDVAGVYYDGPGPATSENVMFYKDANGLPGKAIATGTFNDLHGTDSGGNFAITLPARVRLKAGHYWVSVVANMFQLDRGNWAWVINGTQHGDLAVWRNPQGGWNICRNWCTLESMGLPGPDLVFELKGASK